MKSILSDIAAKHDLPIDKITPLSGGDINNVYLLQGDTTAFVIKTNHADAFPGMFEAEARGLKLLSTSNSFMIPEVISWGDHASVAYLLLEYIPTQSPRDDFWEVFSVRLAQLHRNTNSTFGLDHDNYIGSLPQPNSEHKTAADFYIQERLEPQLKLSTDQGYSFHDCSTAFKNIAKEIPNEPPSLIHGDLWNGNFLVSEDNIPVLIDPAVAYAPREMDLGMMSLFGGFPSEVYAAYQQQFPMEPGWQERQDLWQLYYLWVHLNIFGSSYYDRVATILKRYS